MRFPFCVSRRWDFLQRRLRRYKHMVSHRPVIITNSREWCWKKYGISFSRRPSDSVFYRVMWCRLSRGSIAVVMRSNVSFNFVTLHCNRRLIGLPRRALFLRLYIFLCKINVVVKVTVFYFYWTFYLKVTQLWFTFCLLWKCSSCSSERGVVQNEVQFRTKYSSERLCQSCWNNESI